QGFVVALASFRLERAFIVEVSPRVVTANLVGSAGNTGNVAAIGKLQFELRLLLDRFLEREGFLQPLRLGFVETLGVLDQLNDFVHFLGLEENAAKRRLHRLQREISNASPGEHEVARLLKPHDALTVEEFKGGAEV